MSFEIKIVVLLLSACCTLINLFALVCIVSNFKRLRQRMYIFIINLTIVDVIVGVAYMIDVVTKILRSEASVTSQSEGFGATAATEGLKIASILLSALNTSVVTYALHKRTTSMGRHRAESLNNDTTGNPLHIPAFDTMLRVLSLGTQTPSANRKGSRLNQSSPRKQPSVNGNSPKHINGDCLECEEEETSLAKKNESDRRIGQQRLSPGDKQESSSKSRRKKSMSRLTAMLLPRTSLVSIRPSNFPRSMTSSTYSQSYVGRHGNSVVSVRTTVAILLVIWIVFLITWLLPVATRAVMKASGSSNQVAEIFSCSLECETEYFPNIEQTNNDEKNQSPFSDSNDYDTGVMASNLSTGYVKSEENSTGLHPNPIRRIRHTKSRIRRYKDALFNESGFVAHSLLTVTSESNYTDVNSSGDFPIPWEQRPMCPESCSNLFYPISKLHVIFHALVITVTWLFMLIISLRLLWLRKHSKNVFVRCSALWRFILYTAVFYLVAYATYVAVCVLDAMHTNTPNDANRATSIMMLNVTMNYDRTNRSMTSQPANLVPPHGFEPSLLLLEVASCLVLFHSTIAPSLYMVRLLGFRRLLAGIRFR
nr:uncharacterized protein LOC100176044 isoform X2 [Ciona intestinalis]|eukprot:XP_002127509.1 uncharacterized protein LOC100176044 isoform X2 [Ciona intestinalis]